MTSSSSSTVGREPGPDARRRQVTAAGIGALCAIVLSPGSAGEDLALSVSPMYSSYAVVQRDHPIPVRGHAAPGARIRVTLGELDAESVADEEGRWIAELEALGAGGPYTLEVTSGDETVRSHSILIGDVWLCSGQSNMGFRLENAAQGASALKQDENDRLRLIQMSRRTSKRPLAEVDSRGWRPDRPDYARRFSAVGYFFGQMVQAESGVPIGLLESTWGGTPLEAWTPETTLRSGGAWATPLLESLAVYDLPDAEFEAEVARHQRVHEDYISALLDDEPGLREGWHLPGHPDSNWQSLGAPRFWEPVLGNVDGVVWLRASFELTPEQSTVPAVLNLGMIDEYDDTFVNGERIGGLGYPEPGAGRRDRSYPISDGLLRAGENTIAVRVIDTRSAGGFGSPADQVHVEIGDSRIPLNGGWKARISHDAATDGGFPLEGVRMVPAARQHRRPASLYNGMIHAITDTPIKGVIWYQGESNSGRAAQYAQMFPAMISSWRAAWGQQQMPFHFVQLPNYRARSSVPEQSDWAELREAQAQATHLPRVGMTVAIDVGDAGDIHPRSKRPVGERLADAVLADEYGLSPEGAHSPVLSSAVLHDDGTVLVSFEHAEGLRTLDGEQPKGFVIGDGAGTFVWADAMLDGNRVRLSAPGVDRPAEVRYAWAWNPATNLVNSGGKPAAPFRVILDR